MRVGIDFDGTLLDSRLRHVAALQRAGEELSASIPKEVADAYLRLKCDGLSGIEAMRRLGLCRPEALLRKWVELIEAEELLGLDRLYPDTLEALGRATSRSHQFALATGRHNAHAAKAQVARLGLEKYLSEIVVIDPRHAEQTKAAATRNFGLEAIIGDTEIDARWADELGAIFYASSFGFRSAAYWRRQRVECYSSLSEVLSGLM